MNAEAFQTPADDNTESDSSSEQSQGQPEEFEIKLDSPSSNRKNNPVLRRVIGQRDKARDENAELREELAELKRKVNNPNHGPDAPPKRNDYYSDEDYHKAVRDHVAKDLLKKQPKIDPVQQYKRTQQLGEGLDRHYSRAEKLLEKFPGYSQAEEAAKEILGDEVAQEIALRAKNSAEVLLYLGLNPGEAQRFRDLVREDPVEAGVELGRLDKSVKIESKNKEPAPEPDEVLTGGGNAAHHTGLQKQLDKLREKGDINGAIQLRREAREKGVLLE